jgi:hypothetical protein
MQNSTDRDGVVRETKSERRSGLTRRRRHVLAYGAWHQTVTGYMPEPWLVALEHERVGLPIRPGHRPAANR